MDGTMCEKDITGHHSVQQKQLPELLREEGRTLSLSMLSTISTPANSGCLPTHACGNTGVSQSIEEAHVVVGVVGDCRMIEKSCGVSIRRN